MSHWPQLHLYLLFVFSVASTMRFLLHLHCSSQHLKSQSLEPIGTTLICPPNTLTAFVVSLLSTYVSRTFLKVCSIPAQDPDDPHASLYDVDDENTIITLADWWHTPSIAVSQFFLFISPWTKRMSRPLRIISPQTIQMISNPCRIRR